MPAWCVKSPLILRIPGSSSLGARPFSTKFSVPPFVIVKKKPSDWVEENIILPDGVSRYKGPFSYNISPYAKEIVNRIASDDPARVVSIMKSDTTHEYSNQTIELQKPK